MDKTFPVLADLGMVNALGRGKEEIWHKLQNAAREYRTDRQGLVNCPWGSSPIFVYQGELPKLPQGVYDNRVNQLLFLAADEISESIETAREQWGAHRIGIVLGSTDNGSQMAYRGVESYRKTGSFPKGYSLDHQSANNSSAFLRAHLGLSGPAMVVSTACSSSALSFICARELIEGGLCDAVIIGGSDIVSQAVYLGFQALEAMAPDVCNPFSAERRGITLGEGAALFLMTRPVSEVGGICLLGAGESSDAHHMITPHPESIGAQEAMRRGLKDAELNPKDIDYLNLHGTGTELNDAMESQAVHRLFGGGIPCSSTKSLTGHVLGAAGATEAALCWMALKEGGLPPHCWDGRMDPKMPQLKFVTDSFPEEGLRRVMSNSFAFGGNNVSLVLGYQS